MRSSRFSGAAHILFQEHGAASAAVAADRAEERFANIDVGGFAYWKNVESFIRSSTTENDLSVAPPFPAAPFRDQVSTARGSMSRW